MQLFKPMICIGHKQREIEDAFATAIDGERYADIDRGWIASYAPPDPQRCSHRRTCTKHTGGKLFIDGADLRLAPAVTDHVRDVSGARLVGSRIPQSFRLSQGPCIASSALSGVSEGVLPIPRFLLSICLRSFRFQGRSPYSTVRLLARLRG